MTRRTFLRGVAPTRQRFVEYSGLFRSLLAAADFVTYVYFFGVPGYSHLLPHLCGSDPLWDFFVRGIQNGMHY